MPHRPVQMRIFDFYIGMCTAQLLVHTDMRKKWPTGWALLADGSLFGMTLLAFFCKCNSVSDTKASRHGEGMLFISGFTPLMCLLIVGSSCGRCATTQIVHNAIT